MIISIDNCLKIITENVTRFMYMKAKFLEEMLYGEKLFSSEI